MQRLLTLLIKLLEILTTRLFLMSSMRVTSGYSGELILAWG